MLSGLTNEAVERIDYLCTRNQTIQHKLPSVCWLDSDISTFSSSIRACIGAIEHDGCKICFVFDICGNMYNRFANNE